MNFFCSKKSEDIIYTLPTIIAFGGGHFYFKNFEQYKQLSPLLNAQKYIYSTSVYEKGTKIDVNLDVNISDLNKHLCELYLGIFDKEYDISKPWLSNIPPKHIADIVIGKIKICNIDCSLLVSHKKIVAFVGEKEEEAKQCGIKFTNYLYKNALDFASVIKSSKLYIGSRSLGFAIAEALKHPRVLEASKNDCQSSSSNNEYTYLDNTLIDFHLSDKNRTDIPCVIKKKDIKKSNILSTIFNPSKKTTVFLPNYGEFGCVIDKLVKIVHFHRSPEKIVCCKKGEEAFYPSANRFFYEWEDFIDDEDRWSFFSKPRIKNINRVVHKYQSYKQKAWDDCDKIKSILGTEHNYIGLWDFNIDSIFSRKYSGVFRPELKPIIKQNANVNVVISPRGRKSRPENNCRFWNEIVYELNKRGYSVGCVGQKATSIEVEGSLLNSWDYADNASASLEMMQNCQLYLGIDTGTSHFASLLSVPMIVFLHAGAHDKDYNWATSLMKNLTTNYFYNMGPKIEKASDIIDVTLKFLSR